jgi:hypothetical protein
MIPKSGYRFSEKIMLKQDTKAKWRFNLVSFRFSGLLALLQQSGDDLVPLRC